MNGLDTAYDESATGNGMPRFNLNDFPNFIDVSHFNKSSGFERLISVYDDGKEPELDNLAIQNYLSESPIYIRESTFDLFHKLDLQGEIPHDIVVCEIKAAFPDARNYLKSISQINECPIYGIDYSWQKKLVGLCGNHYMGIQILGSLLANWMYICLGGSARLFSLLPTKNLHLWAYDIGCYYHYKVYSPLLQPYFQVSQEFMYREQLQNAMLNAKWPIPEWEFEI